MNTSTDNSYDDHDEIFAALPWYVNGSLDPAESKRTKAHTKVCLRCRAEVVAQQKIAERIHTADIESLEINAGFENLLARIGSNSTHQEKGAAFAKLVLLTQRWKKRMVGPLSLRVTAAFGMIVVLTGGMLLSKYDSREPSVFPAGSEEYQTLSAKKSGRAFEREILVVFEPGASDKDITSILQKIDATVIKADSENGLKRIALRADEMTRETMLSAVKTLKRTPLITFAEPAIASD